MIMDGHDIIGKEIGNYRILWEINSGAYGSVYKAEHTHLKGRIVAIKLLHSYISSPQEREQFVQEAQFLALLEHPYILPLLDFGFSERQPYLVAQYATDGSLRDVLKRQALLPADKVITILTQVGHALHAAHQQQIIHRDLKPENILFNTFPNALLADFGIATMLSTASVKQLTTIGGTPSYMAPEQFQGIISKEGDQYALGCIAYELVTGHVPFTAPDFLSMGFKHLTEQPKRPTYYNSTLPAITEAAILKALAKQRSERHTNILAFLAALQAPFIQKTLLHTMASPVFSIQPTVLVTAPTPTSSTQAKEQWLVVGKKAYTSKRYTEALTAFEQVISLDPHCTDAYYYKGGVMLLLDRDEEALVAFDQAIRLNPNLSAAYYFKGNALSSLKRYKQALAAYEQAIRLDSTTAIIYVDKGNALFYLKRDQEAMAAYEQAIRLDPTLAIAYVEKGNALYSFKRDLEALAAFELAIHLDPDVAAYVGKGNTLYALKRYEEALAAFEQAIHLAPTMATNEPADLNVILAHAGKGDALKALGKRAESQQAYKKAQELRDND